MGNKSCQNQMNSFLLEYSEWIIFLGLQRIYLLQVSNRLFIEMLSKVGGATMLFIIFLNLLNFSVVVSSYDVYQFVVVHFIFVAYCITDIMFCIYHATFIIELLVW